MGSKVVVLLSGGLDSATVAALAAKNVGPENVVALSFNYGQKHHCELVASQKVANALGIVDHRIVHLDWRSIFKSGAAALVDGRTSVPHDRSMENMASSIPVTYVPSRNITFLAIAASLAESEGASTIYGGMNSVDYSGYPDCREEFLRAFENALLLGTKAGVSGSPIRVVAPLVSLTKERIIRLGVSLGVPYSLTHSCYDPVVSLFGEFLGACGTCDSCKIRRAGFEAAGVADPTVYWSRS